ncbi:SidA/IucD/PvdA family monooxygenase [Methylobacterium sp. E-005]|uniref:lysine N(6)-hydroxylase/L-ornithine N(5)-oxygenase family protein n=1 Tax=Methylobacterium sp. E-005 TaxID=2836549 RepID=UPI001FBAB0F0|nr:SidA/IucD/PvdA family monooxygenase [Methylobacterium sp. E-005]MCJ2087691.1 SidA/IucD/PvdA family monooxygenase [Methylobacterium sp. E-005]
MTDHPLDLAGIGIGPFNLSLAAQLDAVANIDALFFDRAPAFDWHPGMMLPEAALQTSFLKDLVTAVNPTSPWSFLAYLVAQKRFYEFLNAEFGAVPRQEFAQYLAWVAARLPSLRFGTAIHEVRFEAGGFRLRGDGGLVRARNIALGVGLQPNLPAFAGKLDPRDHVHSAQAASFLDRTAGRRVAVIGGGQSGAEIVLTLLNRGRGAPASLDWISRRPNFQPIDATPFTNELFTPGYVERFHALPEARRGAIVAHQKLAGDGISPSTLQAIYRRLYALRHLAEPDATRAPVAARLMPHRAVLDVDRAGGSYRLLMRNGFDGRTEAAQADLVILATGYRFALPPCLGPLRDRLALDATGRPQIGPDFAASWDGPVQNRVFVLNGGLISHGIAEPQLSLMAWRSAVIVNAVAGRTVFEAEAPPSPVSWASAESGQVSHTGAERREAAGARAPYAMV